MPKMLVDLKLKVDFAEHSTRLKATLSPEKLHLYKSNVFYRGCNCLDYVLYQHNIEFICKLFIANAKRLY